MCIRWRLTQCSMKEDYEEWRNSCNATLVERAKIVMICLLTWAWDIRYYINLNASKPGFRQLVCWGRGN